MEVTLSFDNGPDVRETPRVLAILQKYRILATFFLQCDKLVDADVRDTASITKAEGHWIGNHTYSHKAPLGMTTDPEAHIREIRGAQEKLGDLSHPRKFFRPNGKGSVGPHLLSKSAVNLLVDEKYTLVLWSAMVFDGTDPPGWPGRAIKHCQAEPRSTIVVHDRFGGGMGYLEEFILQVLDAGGRFTQDFNPEVIPISEGRIMHSIDQISNDSPETMKLARYNQ